MYSHVMVNTTHFHSMPLLKIQAESWKRVTPQKKMISPVMGFLSLLLVSAGLAFQPPASSIKPPPKPCAKRSGGVEISSRDTIDEPKILVKAIAGSKLYGTNLPTSDSDYKIIFLPSINNIIRLNVTQAFFSSTGGNAKNTNKDVDVECFELRRYLQMVERGDTVALDLLFTPDDLIIEQDPLWEDLKGLCKKYLLTGKAANFSGPRTEYGVQILCKGTADACFREGREGICFCPK